MAEQDTILFRHDIVLFRQPVYEVCLREQARHDVVLCRSIPRYEVVLPGIQSYGGGELEPSVMRLICDETSIHLIAYILTHDIYLTEMDSDLLTFYDPRLLSSMQHSPDEDGLLRLSMSNVALTSSTVLDIDEQNLPLRGRSLSLATHTIIACQPNDIHLSSSANIDAPEVTLEVYPADVILSQDQLDEVHVTKDFGSVMFNATIVQSTTQMKLMSMITSGIANSSLQTNGISLVSATELPEGIWDLVLVCDNIGLDMIARRLVTELDIDSGSAARLADYDNELITALEWKELL